MSQHKRPTQKQRVLQLLRSAGRSGMRTNDFLAEHLPRFGARIHELRQEGYAIMASADPASESGMVYRLLADRPGSIPVTVRERKAPERSVEDRIKAVCTNGNVVVTYRTGPAALITRWTISGGAGTVVHVGATLEEALADAERGHPVEHD